MRFAQEIFGFTEADWIDAARLRAKVLGAVAHHRAHLTAPERSEATFAALHHALAGALAAEGVPDPEAVALGLLAETLVMASDVKEKAGHRPGKWHPLPAGDLLVVAKHVWDGATAGEDEVLNAG